MPDNPIPPSPIPPSMRWLNEKPVPSSLASSTSESPSIDRDTSIRVASACFRVLFMASWVTLHSVSSLSGSSRSSSSTPSSVRLAEISDRLETPSSSHSRAETMPRSSRMAGRSRFVQIGDGEHRYEVGNCDRGADRRERDCKEPPPRAAPVRGQRGGRWRAGHPDADQRKNLNNQRPMGMGPSGSRSDRKSHRRTTSERSEPPAAVQVRPAKQDRGSQQSEHPSQKPQRKLDRRLGDSFLHQLHKKRLAGGSQQLRLRDRCCGRVKSLKLRYDLAIDGNDPHSRSGAGLPGPGRSVAP